MWNYRIIKSKDVCFLHEVMYNDDGEIFAHTKEPQAMGDDPVDLLKSLELMVGDVKKHIERPDLILEEDKIVFHPIDDGSEDYIEIKDLDDLLK